MDNCSLAFLLRVLLHFKDAPLVEVDFLSWRIKTITTGQILQSFCCKKFQLKISYIFTDSIMVLTTSTPLPRKRHRTFWCLPVLRTFCNRNTYSGFLLVSLACLCIYKWNRLIGFSWRLKPVNSGTSNIFLNFKLKFSPKVLTVFLALPFLVFVYFLPKLIRDT